MVSRKIAIIPARGGSKRIPGKNILNFIDKPMIAWTIESALKSGLFDKVVVSTDDEEIAKVSKCFGADVPFLRKAFSDDHSPVSLATISTLKECESYWNIEFDITVQLMANCPLRDENVIRSFCNKFEELDRDFQISCFKYGWMNPWWAVQLDGGNIPTRIFPDSASKRSQDLPELYCPTGAIWIAKSELLKTHQTFYGPSHCFEPIDWMNAVDIDNYEDLDFAKVIHKYKLEI